MHDLFCYTSITADSMQFPLMAITATWQFDSKTHNYATMFTRYVHNFQNVDSGACSGDKASQ